MGFNIVPLWLLTVAAFASASARAQPLPPAAALDWLDPSLAYERLLVARLAEEASRGEGIGFEASLEPHLRFRDYPADGRVGTWSAGLALNASIDLGDAADTHARTLQSLERARHDLEVLELDSVTEALLAHANLLLAQERESEARIELTEAREELAELDPAGEEVRALRLEFRLAELEHREAHFELNQARVEAGAFGLEGEAVYRPLRFRLPAADIDPRRTHGYRMLSLELLEARAELAEATRHPLDDLRLRTGYRLPDVEFEIEGGLLNGEPGATVGVDLPGGVERWEVEVSAQLVLEDTRHEIERLELALAAARAELEEYPKLFRAELENGLVRASLAERALVLGEEERELSGDSGRLYRAWIDYVRAVAELLELCGEEWAVRVPR